MSADQQDKKMNANVGESLAGKDDKVIPVKPADLSDEELDKVAGGGGVVPAKTPSPHISKLGTSRGDDTIANRR